MVPLGVLAVRPGRAAERRADGRTGGRAGGRASGRAGGRADGRTGGRAGGRAGARERRGGQRPQSNFLGENSPEPDQARESFS